MGDNHPTCPCCGAKVSPIDLVMDESTGIVMHEGVTVRLPAQQFRLLKALLDAYPRTLTKDTLLSAVATGPNPDDWPEPKLVDVLVCRVRKLIDPMGLVIATQWGVGYHLEIGDEAKAALIKSESFNATRNVRSSIDDADIKNVARLRAEGWPSTEIARRLKLTYRAVAAAIDKIEQQRRAA
ncbi:winged helix-turn-helix domain-containing protein [Aurantimonas litoralis]|nr:winged helix-turn-helix domain-containing protein [Aurantimonas litoralis]